MSTVDTKAIAAAAQLRVDSGLADTAEREMADQLRVQHPELTPDKALQVAIATRMLLQATGREVG